MSDPVLPTHASDEKASIEKREREAKIEHAKLPSENINVRLVNPLLGFTHEQLSTQGEQFAKRYELGDHAEVFAKGAIVAQDPSAFESLSMLNQEEKDTLRMELTHKWKQPRELYYLVITCSMAAAVQGMDQAVINGANLFFADQFGIPQVGPNASQNQWLLGITNAAPYVCCAVLGCWLTVPLNNLFGRRGTIFLTALISFLACFWQGFTNTWPHLFAARFVMGLGIGPKSTTVPVYAAECAPPLIRGALVMMWQMWTAFGIMLGNVADLALFQVPDPHNIKGLNWRLMLGSAGLPAIAVCAQVYFCPESPRWLMSKGRYAKAFRSLQRLRGNDLLAARDLFYIHTLLEGEAAIKASRGNLLVEMFTIPRNRRAALGSFIVMFMQQLCGVNSIAYYSSTIFQQSGFTSIQALLASFGFGAINFVFAFPAVYTIDTFGRRNLLLTTFPLMALFLLVTGFAFFIKNLQGRVGMVAAGIYLFGVCYSPGEGPVPFTYSAEAFPLYIRSIGMSFATATTWFFNAIVSLTFPRMLGAFTPQGAFGWYAGWNIVGFFLVLLFLPETKSLSLEELDQVFSVPTRKHAAYQFRAFVTNFRRRILRQRVDEPAPLYHFEGIAKTYAPAAGGH